MKKIFGLLLLCVATLGFVSCEKGANGENGENDFSAEWIVGTWETTQAYVGGQWLNIPYDTDMYATMTFYEDGRYYGDSELFGSGWGSYELNSRTLNTYYNDKLFYTYTIKSLTATAAEVSMAYSGANIAIKLKKK